MNTIRARALIVAGLVDMAASQGARAAIMAHMPPNAAFPGGAEGFALKVSGGRFNPELLVRLNQLPDQPDAPRTLINLLAPAKPKLSLRAGSNFEFALTFREFGGLTLPTFPPPDLKGGTSISFCVDERMFAVNLVISCSSRVKSWSSVVPRDLAPHGSTGAAFGLEDDIGVQVEINVFENRAPLSLTGEPEPMTFALMETGLRLIAAGACQRSALNRRAGVRLH